MPTKCLLSILAAIPVVELPANGSKIKSPSFVLEEIINFNNSIGF
jgi:hypothetical protein